MRDIKYIIKRVIIGLLISLSIMFLKSNVFALTTKTVFSDSSLSNSNKFNYGYLSGGVETTAIGTIGTNVSRASTGLTFFLSENVVLNKTYTLKINFTGDDLYKSFSSNGVVIQSCYSDTCNDSVIVSMTKQSTTARSTYVIFKFNPTSVGSYLRVNLHGSSAGVEILGPVSFGISSVQIESTNVNQDIIDNQTNNTNNIIDNQNSNTQDIIDNQTDNTNNIIDNQNSNTQDLIDNQNSNTQDIIDNQNQNTQDLIDDNKKNFQTCRDSYNLLEPNFTTLTYRGITVSSSNNGFVVNGSSTHQSYSDFNIFEKELPVGTYTINGLAGASGTTYQIGIYKNGTNIKYLAAGSYTFTLDSSSTILIRLFLYTAYGTFDNVILPYQLTKSSILLPYEPYGEEICTNKIDDTNQKLDELNNSINDDNIDNSNYNSFFSNFNTNTFGLTSIITAPLNLIQSLTSSSCSPVNLPIPYLDNQFLTLPCMSEIYSEHFSSFFTLYQTITFGIVAYWVCVRIFNLVKDFKNPEHDEIEVLDL